MKFLENALTWLAKHTTGEALLIILISLMGGYNGATKDPTIKGWQRWVNVIAGGITAILSGFALSEAGQPIWMTSLSAYLIGNIGNTVVNGLINWIRQWEANPTKFIRQVIALARQLLQLLKDWFLINNQPPK
ncbi:hypothetical protein ACFQ4C_18055 [Larkinella insperata]|uniref:Holin n=1 Tax=Larkinella insperata TaxID=332158 RepID=A0ABW3QBK2_9BACT|nr:hypothetical protein [Larkinella insperata]